jgi:hypothetical protein
MKELDELFVRAEVQKILSEQMEDVTWGDILPPSADQFYDTFIGPFVDVYKVAKVAFKDSADAILTTIQAVFTFDLEKKKVLMDKFRKKRDKYKAEMADAMKTTNEALSSPDAQLIMFMMSPGAYLGAGMAREAADVAEPFTDFAQDKLGNFGKMLGLGSDYTPPGKGGSQGPLRGLMGDLKALFFGTDMTMTTGDMGMLGQGSPVAGVAGGPVKTEALDEIDELERILREGDEEKEGSESPERVSEKEAHDVANHFLETTGAGEKINGYAKEIIESKKAEAEEVKKQYSNVINGLNEASKAQSLEELSSLIQPLAEAGLDLKPQAQEIEKLVQDQKDTLSAGGDKAKEMIEQLKQTPDGAAIPDDAKPDAWFKILEQSAIATAFADAVSEAKKQGIGEVIGFVAEMPRSDLEQISKASELGKQFADVIFQLENDLLSV